MIETLKPSADPSESPPGGPNDFDFVKIVIGLTKLTQINMGYSLRKEESKWLQLQRTMGTH